MHFHPLSVSCGLLVIANCVALYDVPGLLTALERDHSFTEEHLHPAMRHEHALHEDEQRIPYMLLCSSYEDFPRLQAAVPLESVSHPVLHSQAKDKSCAIMSGETAKAATLSLQRESSITSYTQSIIPHVFKYHQSIDESIDTEDSDSITLEVAVGLGTSGKGFDASKGEAQLLVKSLFERAANLLQHEDLATEHWDKFYWTSKAAHNAASSSGSVGSRVRDQKYRKSVASSAATMCDYDSLLTVGISQSYISFTADSTSLGYSPECMRLLATVAVMNPSVAHVSAHLGMILTAPSELQQKEAVGSISFSDPAADPATDQNAWVQSGTSEHTPYTDIGVDGTGYVLGMMFCLLCVSVLPIISSNISFCEVYLS